MCSHHRYKDFEHIKTDPDLDALRTHRKAFFDVSVQMAQLTAEGR